MVFRINNILILKCPKLVSFKWFNKGEIDITVVTLVYIFSYINNEGDCLIANSSVYLDDRDLYIGLLTHESLVTFGDMRRTQVLATPSPLSTSK